MTTITAENLYSYHGQTNLTPGRLLFWVLMDQTAEHFGLKDIAAIFAIVIGQPWLLTPGKFNGATPGTSIASLAARAALDVELPFRLPMITGASLGTLRIAFTRNLGAFVGRTIPIIGWVVLAVDVSEILWKTITIYNAIVKTEDRVL